jgi:hypothetical protein
VPLQIEEDPFEVSFVEDLLLLSGTKEESGTAEVVDLASDALGVVVEEGEEAIGEDGVLTTNDAEVMFGISSSFLDVEGSEVVADGDTLVESLEGNKTELVSEVGVTEKDESEEGGRVHLIVE